jgi:hypothetical protein
MAFVSGPSLMATWMAAEGRQQTSPIVGITTVNLTLKPVRKGRLEFKKSGL